MTSIKDRQKKTWPHLLSAHVSSLSTEIAPTESGCSHELQMQPSLTKTFVNLYVWRGHTLSQEEQKSPRLPTWSHPGRSNERQSSAITHITLQSAENEKKKKSCLGDFTLLSQRERWLCVVKIFISSLHSLCDRLLLSVAAALGSARIFRAVTVQTPKHPALRMSTNGLWI